MKIIVFILTFLRHGFSPAEVVAFNERIVDEYALRLYVRSNCQTNEQHFTIGEITRNVFSRYEDGVLKMYMLLPIPNSVILEEWHCGYFTKTGKLIEVL
ncbi:MAG: hypothetical protein ACK5I7_08625 [Anaerotignum sp.]